MAGPWERYQEPAAAGPWAKYGQKADFSGVRSRSETTADDPDPLEGMSTLDRLAAGFGSSYADLARGTKQALTEAIAQPLGASGNALKLLGLDRGAAQPSDAVNASLARQQAAIDEAARIDAPLKSDAAGMAGNVAGAVTQLVGPGVALRGTRAQRAFLPTTVRGNAAQGAAFGAVQPVETGGSRAMNTAVGAGAGAAGALIPRAVGGTVNAFRRVIPPMTQGAQTRAAGQVLNQFAADPAALRAGANAPEVLVPGSMPTLAEATGDVGLAGLQRTLANTPDFGNALTQRQQANNLARVRAVEGAFGGADDSASAAVRETRDRAASQVLRPIDTMPMSTLNRVVAGVNRLAERHQAAPAVRQAMDAVREELPNIRTVGDAHAVRQYIGQLIGGQVEGRAGARLARRELMTVQNLLDREMRAAYPEWGQFLREYRGLSRQADQIDVGAELLATGRAVRSATNDPQLTPAAFGRAAGNLDRTVQRATGFPRATAERTLTAEQRTAVDAIRRDLERYSRASTDGKAIGSNTVQNAIGGNSFQSAVGPVGAAVVEPVSGIALLGLNQMRSRFGGRVAGLVEEAMLDPARAAEILAAVPPSQRSEVVRAAAPLIARASSVSGVISPTLSE